MKFAPNLARLATPQDCFKILELYHRIYNGQYPDTLMTDLTELRKFLSEPNHFWFVMDGADSSQPDLIASVVINYDPENKIAKALGAIVDPSARGSKLMERLLDFAIQWVHSKTGGLDVVYATTRTVHEAAQALTERLGFRKLGIFPNSHKTDDYETLCLTALYFNRAVENRFKSYSIHSALEGLLTLIGTEVPEMGELTFLQPDLPTRQLVEPPILEIIESENFVRHRFERLKTGGALQFAFFPFHTPNLLVTSPDQSVEIFCYHSRQDGYSVIIGGKVDETVSYTSLFNTIANLLREVQARYVELLIRADKPKIIDSILKAKFIPSAFFPAFQLHDGKRYDYVVMSRTFETFDFQNVHLKGMNQMYLEEYVRQWMKSANYPLEASRRPALRFSTERPQDTQRQSSSVEA